MVGYFIIGFLTHSFTYFDLFDDLSVDVFLVMLSEHRKLEHKKNKNKKLVTRSIALSFSFFFNFLFSSFSQPFRPINAKCLSCCLVCFGLFYNYDALAFNKVFIHSFIHSSIEILFIRGYFYYYYYYFHWPEFWILTVSVSVSCLCFSLLLLLLSLASLEMIAISKTKQQKNHNEMNSRWFNHNDDDVFFPKAISHLLFLNIHLDDLHNFLSISKISSEKTKQNKFTEKNT